MRLNTPAAVMQVRSDAALMAEYLAETAARTLQRGRVAALVGLAAIAYFTSQDVLLLGDWRCMPWRVLGFAALALYLAFAPALSRAGGRGVVPLYAVTLGCVMTMVCGIVFHVLTTPGLPSSHKLGVTQGLTATIFVLYLCAAGARKYLPFVFAVPLAVLFLSFALGGSLGVVDWSFFSNPVLVAVASVVIGRAQDRSELAEFAMRRLVEQREEELRTKLAKENEQSGALARLVGRLENEARENKQMSERLASLAAVDDLTGVLNRRASLAYLEKMIGLCARSGKDVSICYLDVDDLKSVNDRGGHTHGDALLAGFAAALKETVRVSDAVGRMGGDEFLAILPQCDAAGAEATMERFRARLAGRGIDFSFGVATYERGGRASIDKLIDAADRAMYAQKQGKKRRSDPAARG